MTETEKLYEHLTQKAMEAAAEGKWGQVVQCYDQRMSAGLQEKISPNVAKKLMPKDQWLMTRIREVQALTQQHLEEAQYHRRRLSGFKRQWVGDHTTVQARHRLSI